MRTTIPALSLIFAAGLISAQSLSSLSGKVVDASGTDLGLPGVSVKFEAEQITHYGQDKKHHLFGYIGHGLTIPWNRSERYILTLRTDFYDRVPEPGETADIAIIDTQNDYKVTVVDKTRAWTMQQGTMFYWNPNKPETQFFFNDSDSSGSVWTVLFDIETMTRVREYRFGGTTGVSHDVANGGVAPDGSCFAGINYGRVTMRDGDQIDYADARNDGEAGNPSDDGLFKVDIATGKATLLASYPQLAEAVGSEDRLYVHHTLWNRESNLISFVVRGGGKLRNTTNKACVIRSDGSGLQEITQVSHPEWWEGSVAARPGGGGLELFDVYTNEVVDSIGPFKSTKDDNAYSPDGQWWVASDDKDGGWFYQFYRFSDKILLPDAGPFLDRGISKGEARVDGAPRWNRTSNGILVGGVVREDGPDKDTRQLAILRLVPGP